MTKENLILICASLIVTQLVVVHCNEENIDWTTVHEELRKLAGNLRKKCTNEISITEDILEDAELGNFPEGDNKLACYFKCVMDKGGVMKKDGKINYKLLSKMMPAAYRHIGQEMLDECRNISGDDKCTIALNFNKCMFRANPVAYFVI
uniref:Odorant-binding protein 11 n=1 Tax=Camponotus japonicus TaxID=84547 RepID=W6JGW7_9HYME|nr:odorant-binding protein 11 [Camponotus japonicus]